VASRTGCAFLAKRLFESEERKAATVCTARWVRRRASWPTGVRDALQLQAVLQRNAGLRNATVRVDYAEIVDAQTFDPVIRVKKALLCASRVFVGKTR